MKRMFFIFLLITAMVLGGCTNQSPSNQSTDQSSPKPNTEGESRTANAGDKILTIATGSDILGFDIHNHRNTSTEAIHINMFSYLIKNENGKFVPDLAGEWKNIDDLTWEFKLRKGAKFHNGDTVTSEDVKFTLERVAKDEKILEYPNYRQIKEVGIIDENTFKIHTVGPEPALLNRLSRLGSGILPKKYIEENGWDHFKANPVGSGPYKFVEWVRDDHVTLEKFPEYFGGNVSDWDKVVFRVLPESSTRVAEVLTGGVDIANNINPTDWDRVNQNVGTSIINGPTNRTMLLYLRNTKGYPTSDVRVRQAIDLAINEKALVDNVLGGGGTPSITRMNPGNVGTKEDLWNTYRYDLDKAKQLMTETGYPNGFEMTIHGPNGRYMQDKQTLEVIAGMLSQIGIKVKLEFMEWGAFSKMEKAGENKDAYLIGRGNSMFDAAQALSFYGTALTKKKIDYTNPEVEELLKKAEVNMNPEERVQQYYRIQDILAEEVPILTLFQLNNFYAVNDRVDFKPRLDEMWRVDQIKLKK